MQRLTVTRLIANCNKAVKLTHQVKRLAGRRQVMPFVNANMNVISIQEMWAVACASPFDVQSRLLSSKAKATFVPEIVTSKTESDRQQKEEEYTESDSEGGFSFIPFIAMGVIGSIFMWGYRGSKDSSRRKAVVADLESYAVIEREEVVDLQLNSGISMAVFERVCEELQLYDALDGWTDNESVSISTVKEVIGRIVTEEEAKDEEELGLRKTMSTPSYVDDKKTVPLGFTVSTPLSETSKMPDQGFAQKFYLFERVLLGAKYHPTVYDGKVLSGAKGGGRGPSAHTQTRKSDSKKKVFKTDVFYALLLATNESVDNKIALLFDVLSSDNMALNSSRLQEETDGKEAEPETYLHLAKLSSIIQGLIRTCQIPQEKLAQKYRDWPLPCYRPSPSYDLAFSTIQEMHDPKSDYILEDVSLPIREGYPQLRSCTEYIPQALLSVPSTVLDLYAHMQNGERFGDAFNKAFFHFGLAEEEASAEYSFEEETHMSQPLAVADARGQEAVELIPAEEENKSVWLTEDEFFDVLMSKKVCLWGECYRKRRPRTAEEIQEEVELEVQALPQLSEEEMEKMQQLRDTIMGAEPGVNFIEASTFVCPKPGYVFTTREHGTGYYRDIRRLR